ncbi:putative serine/threonine-protein kinase-like protein CCR3 [Forsythia ovata]|uniref:non-specific serine/threonine protein kinase n=1 Tax=Forsythia ovata TaxID=205694 RepID=A0ABD1WJR7_9LAMI
MTTPFTAAIIILLTAVSSLSPSAHALGGSAATVAVVYGSATTICTIISQQPLQQIQCWQNGQLLPPIIPTTSFDYIAGGRDTLCATRSGGFILLCWNTTFNSKRLYNNYSAPLTSLTIGDTQICGLTNITSRQSVICWRGNEISSVQTPNGTLGFSAISSGLGFSCGVLEGNSRVLCWGDDNNSVSIQSEFSNFSMSNIQVGGRHACGMDNSGVVICKGNNENSQLDVPSNSSYEYSGLALGSNHSCAIRRLNRTVVCWGGDGEFSSNVTDGISFESIVAGLNYTCGLTTILFFWA